jgi:predicted enzyme related to lactoylglutathione lyase
VDDVAQSLAALVAAGAETVQDPTDVGGGHLIALARDGDGNLIGLRQAG